MESSKEFSTICRFCTGTESLQNLFKNTEILEKIAVITDLEIQESDQLPNQICDPCIKMVIQSHSFRLKCHQIDEQLRDLVHFENSIVKEFSENNDIKYEKTFPMICEEFAIPHSEVLAQENLSTDHIEIEFLAPDSNFGETVQITEKKDNEIGQLSDAKSGDISSSKSKEVIDTFENSAHKDEEINFNQIQNENTPHEGMNDSSINEQTGLAKCGICWRYYATKKSLRMHMRFHTDNDVPCSLCDVFEITKCALRSHVEAVHNLNPDTMQPFAPRKCPKCKQVFTDLAELNKHKKTHKKQFECEVCKQVYITKYQLDTHRKVHIGQAKDGRYPCYKCGKVFAHRVSMMRHEQIVHSDAKPFECNICSATFAIKERLEIHLTFHNH